jgi:hypothetical protein
MGIRTRLWLLGLAALATAFGSPSAPARVAADRPSEIVLEGPSVSASHNPHSLALRGEERIEFRTTEQQLLDAGSTDPYVQPAALLSLRLLGEATWHGLVQCRRLAGAQLLHYATPPPARG